MAGPNGSIPGPGSRGGLAQEIARAFLTTPSQNLYITPPRRIFSQSGVLGVPAGGDIDDARVIGLGKLAVGLYQGEDLWATNQDGFSFDRMMVNCVPQDDSGSLTLTDLQLVLTVPTAAPAVPVALVGGAFPTLISPRSIRGVSNPLGGTLVPVLDSGVITGSDMQLWGLQFGGSAIPLPQQISLFICTHWHNSDAVNPHSIQMTFFGRYRKLTGIEDG